MSEVIGLITARGGSKSIPNKNIHMLAGKPLIAWTIEAAQNSRSLNRVIVSTDDPKIASISETYGAEVPFMRPAELSQDGSDHISVVRHAMAWLEQNERFVPDYLMLLQPTSPLRTSEDIDAATELAEARNAEAVVAVSEMKPHPYLSRQMGDDGILTELISTNIPYLQRQALPLAFAINGAMYLNRPASLLKHLSFTPNGTLGYVMPPERSIDVDTPWDLYIAELILRRRVVR